MGQRGEYEDLMGKTFTDLYVEGPADSRWESGKVKYYWTVRCSCGTIFEARGSALKHGSPQSCFPCGRKRAGRTNHIRKSKIMQCIRETVKDMYDAGVMSEEEFTNFKGIFV